MNELRLRLRVHIQRDTGGVRSQPYHDFMTDKLRQIKTMQGDVGLVLKNKYRKTSPPQSCI